MASSPKSLLRKMMCMISILISSLGLPVSALKSPFNPHDVLPLLPRQVSWPILNSLHSAVDLLPAFVGAASSPNDSLEWKGACFYKNTAWMEFHNKSGSEFGGGTLHLKVGLEVGFLILFYSICMILKFETSRAFIIKIMIRCYCYESKFNN